MEVEVWVWSRTVTDRCTKPLNDRGDNSEIKPGVVTPDPLRKRRRTGGTETERGGRPRQR